MQCNQQNCVYVLPHVSRTLLLMYPVIKTASKHYPMTMLALLLKVSLAIEQVLCTLRPLLKITPTSKLRARARALLLKVSLAIEQVQCTVRPLLKIILDKIASARHVTAAHYPSEDYPMRRCNALSDHSLTCGISACLLGM